MFDGRWRTSIERGLAPVGTTVRRTGLRADHITLTGVAMAVVAAVVIGSGNLTLGLVFLIFTGIPDLIDGAVAKAWGQTSTRGAFLDSVSDRFTDALLFGGVAWYLADTRPGPLAVLPFAVFAAASLTSYVRAKADALGLDARGGLVERAERFILLGIGLLAEPLLVPVLWLMLVLCTTTVVQRFARAWRTASAPVPVPRQRSPRRRPRTPAARTTRQRWSERSRRFRERP